MNEKDFLYGCHSAIQKAIRRSDLNLAKTAFEAMWSEKEHRNWLKWRFVILAEEDCWQMLGEAARFLAEKPGDNEKDWKRMIYRLCLVDKSKDPEPLSTLAVMHCKKPCLGRNHVSHPEMKAMLHWIKKMEDSDPSTVAGPLMDWCKEQRDLSEYEYGALRIAKSRVHQGGMLADRIACLGAMILITLRGLPEETITNHIKECEETRIVARPRGIVLPWYVFDMHTQAGQMALNVFMKRRAGSYPAGLTKGIVDCLWFFYESAVHAHENLIPFKADAKPTCFESMWWPVFIKETTHFGKVTAKKAKQIWDEQMKDDIRRLVTWALDKRASD